MSEAKERAWKSASPEVVAAIDTLTTSSRYEPSERWLPAYTALAKVRADLRRSHRPFLLARLLAAAILLVAFYYANSTLPLVEFRSWWLFMALSSLFFALSLLSGILIGMWARRRHPLLALQPDIEDACKYFDDAAANLPTGVGAQ